MEITEGKLKRLRNLPSFKGKTDEELIEYMLNRVPKERKPRSDRKNIPAAPAVPATYDERFALKLNQLKEEYGIDMNDSNDAENLQTLVRLSIQAEDIDLSIRTESGNKYIDTKRLKDLGDFQKNLVASTTDLQDKLGITRKVRKEKQIDDIPQYLKEVRRKARDFWERKTVPIRCEKCEIELARYWLNFPHLTNKITYEGSCYKCGEKVIFVDGG